jgi:hypothetical protein
MKKVILILLVSMFLTACSVEVNTKADQIKAQAEANAKAIQAQQDALDQEQERQQQAAINQLELKKQQEQNNLDIQALAAAKSRDETTKTIIWERVNMMWEIGLLVACAVLVYAIFMIGRTTVAQINRIQTGLATAMITMIDIRSRSIYLDDKGQYPLLYEYTGKGMYTLTDPNTGATQLLDTRNDGDAQKIAGAIAIRHTGIVARETRRAQSDTAPSVALVQNPPIIEGSAVDIKTVAKELLGKGSTNE